MQFYIPIDGDFKMYNLMHFSWVVLKLLSINRFFGPDREKRGKTVRENRFFRITGHATITYAVSRPTLRGDGSMG